MSDERMDEENRYMAGKEPSVDAAALAVAGMVILVAVGLVCRFVAWVAAWAM
jgi:hypothetical protein